jgi:hypothetical protein
MMVCACTCGWCVLRLPYEDTYMLYIDAAAPKWPG